MKCFPARLSCFALVAVHVATASAQPAAEEDVEIEAVSAPQSQPGETPEPAPSAPDALQPSAAAQPAVAPAEGVPAVDAPPSATTLAAEERAAALEARLRAIEVAEAERARANEQAQASPAAPAPDADEAWLGLEFSAFVQAQYETSQLSEDQLQQGGEPINRNRFLVRRARLRVQRSWAYVDLDFELDANTVEGLDVVPRRAAGSVFWPASNPRLPPLVRAQLGLLDIPFGYELPAGSRKRVFAERSRASLAFFPREPDIGATVSGALGPVRYAAAVLNGQEADASYWIRDANAAKDLVARVGVDLEPESWLSIASGVSFLEGTGFHPGDDATKNDLQWIDVNEDGSKSEAEVFGVPGTAATPSKNFDRWAIGLDAALGLRTRIGWSRLYGEVTFAQNLDRGLFVADPIASSLDAREVGYYAAFTQELGRYALVGFRLDFYNGNSDLFEKRHGASVQMPQWVRTYSPVIGVVLPERARLTLQYDVIDDRLSRDERGEPAGLSNNQWTLRLQVGL